MASTLHGMLSKIHAADQKQVVAQFDIANLLTAILDHKLFEQDGYDNFRQMIHMELDFSPATAMRYVNLYNSYTRLRYSKEEFLKHMRTFGWSHLRRALEHADTKMGHRAIKKHIDDHMSKTVMYFGSAISPQDEARINSALSRFGMETNKSGHRSGVTTAMLALIEDYERLTKVRDKNKAA